MTSLSYHTHGLNSGVSGPASMSGGGSPSSASPTTPTTPSPPSSSASTPTPTYPPPSDTVLAALSATAFKTKNTRRDLTTSYRAFKQAWSSIERTTVLHHSARRIGERAANVLLVTTEKLQAYEPKDEREKILGKVPAYEFQAEANPQETVFKLQSIMIDLQTAMTLLASPRQDQQVLLVRDLPSTVRSLETLNAQLTNAVEMYELFISTEPWVLENEHDLAADYAALPRLFQLAFALRGPLYTGFLKEHPAPPGEIASISKRRDDYLAWCLETNPLLRQDPSTPNSTRKRWIPMTPSPEGSPVSPLFPKGVGSAVPVLSRSRAPSSPTAISPTGGLRRMRSSTMVNEVGTSPPSTKAGNVDESVENPASSPETSSPIPSSPPSTAAALSTSPEEVGANTPDSTPQVVTSTSIYLNKIADRASRLSTDPDERSFLSIGDNPSLHSDSTISDEEPESPTSGAPRPLPRPLENGSPKSSPSTEQPPSKGLGILDSLNAATPIDSDASPKPLVEEKKSTLLSSPRAPRRVPSTPTLPVIPEDELYRPEPTTPIPSFIVRPATPPRQSLEIGAASSNPQNTSLRILSLDGGGIRGLTLLYALRSKLGKDSPPPCEVFDLIAGCGTGGLVAILLGRLRMTIDDAIHTYLSIARKAFISKELLRKKGRWSRLFGGAASMTDNGPEVGKLVPGTRDHGLEEALVQHLDDVPMLEEPLPKKQTRCKVAVLAYEQSSYGGDGAPVWFRSYINENDENLDSTSIRTVIRATMSSSAFFRPFQTTHDQASFIVAPESLNPADLTLDEAQRIAETIVPEAIESSKLEILQFLSLGVGQIPSGIHLSSKTKMRSLKLVTRIVDENRSAYERVLRRARREGWSERIERIDVDLLARDDKGIDEWVYHILLRDGIERFVKGTGEKTSTAGAAGGVGSADFDPTTDTTKSEKSNASTNPRPTSMLSTFSFRRSSQRFSIQARNSSSSTTSPLRRSVSLTNLRTSLNPMYLQRDASTASLDADVARGSFTSTTANTSL